MINLDSTRRPLLCFFLVICCILSYTSYATNDVFQEIKDVNVRVTPSEIIKEKEFLDALNNADSDSEFRILAKLSHFSNLDFLKNYGKNLQSFTSYSGIAITLRKTDLMLLIQRNVFKEIWSNAEITALSDINQLCSLNFTQTISNYTDHVKAPELWDDEIYGTNTLVAILDTGIKMDHLALSQNMENEDRIVNTWNFVSHNSNVDDDNGHGTEIAGIIGSNGLNGYMQGVAPNCKFLIGKILASDKTGTIENLILGIDWAIENNADVINLSVGKPVSNKTAPEVEAVNNAVSQGVVVCVSSGNSRKNVDFGYNDLFTVYSPGIASKAICVGAVDNNNILYEYSSAGSAVENFNSSSNSALFDSISTDGTWLKPDVVAPGVKLNTTGMNGDTTILVSGTSYATAVVSGLCLLLLQKYSDTLPSVIKCSLLETSHSLGFNVISPFNENINISPSTQYQGAGVVDVSSASSYLLNPSNITLWPSLVPYTTQYYFVNSNDSFIFHLFINNEINNLKVTIPDAISKIIKISGLPTASDIGQYDIEMTISTEMAYQGRLFSYIAFEADNVQYQLDIVFYVRNAKGRILLNFGEQGDNIFYSLYGSLRNFIELSRKVGLIPMINSRDINSGYISSFDINSFEVISLMNFNNSIYQTYPNEYFSLLSDYLMPNGTYGGGSLLLFPSTNSDLSSLNNFLVPFNISYEALPEDNKTLDLLGYYDILSSIPNDIYKLFIPTPFNITSSSESYLSLENSFVYADFRNYNGSLLIAANNIDMFLDSPYLYSSEKAGYDELIYNGNFGNNEEMLENLLYASSVRSLLFDYEINSLEVKYKEKLQIKIHVHNQYKSLKNWNFYFTLETRDAICYRFYEFTDLLNGSYIISFTPSDHNIIPGDYLLRVRSYSETETWSISILARISWGPVIVELSILVSVVFLILYKRIRITK